MKYRLPKHCRAVVHEGVTLEAGPEGSVEAPEAAAPALLAHGVVPWLAAASPRAAARALPALGDVDALSRTALADALSLLGHKTLPTSTEELRRALRRALVTRLS